VAASVPKREPDGPNLDDREFSTRGLQKRPSGTSLLSQVVYRGYTRGAGRDARSADETGLSPRGYRWEPTLQPEFDGRALGGLTAIEGDERSRRRATVALDALRLRPLG
jgi:hypothetical protein